MNEPLSPNRWLPDISSGFKFYTTMITKVRGSLSEMFKEHQQKTQEVLSVHEAKELVSKAIKCLQRVNIHTGTQNKNMYNGANTSLQELYNLLNKPQESK